MIVYEIVNLVPFANVESFSKCSRKENQAAHVLERAAVVNDDFSYFFLGVLYFLCWAMVFFFFW